MFHRVKLHHPTRKVRTGSSKKRFHPAANTTD